MPEPKSLGPLEVQGFRELIRDRSGLVFTPSREGDLQQVIATRVACMGLPDAEALFALLGDGTRGEAILEALIADLTVGETYFFRNQPQFHALERHILPELIARRRPVRQLRLWSAGCATGEEPYSLAILVERLLPDLNDWKILILATDINPRVLASAQAGIYNSWSFRHVPVQIKEDYFLARGDQYEIQPRLRGRVTFARLNLVEDVFPSFRTHTCELDLILCRNVLIYFNAETVRRIADRFYRATAEGGWLIVGHSEPSQAHFGKFAAHNFPGTVVYRKGAACTQASASWQANEPRLKSEPVALGANLPGVPGPAPAVSRESSAPPARIEQSAYQKAKLLADRREWDQAEKWIAIAIEQAPLSAAAHYLHGLILLETARPDAALAALRRCVFADADHVLGHMALADLFARLGQRNRARKSLETAARLAQTRRADEPIPEGDGLTAGRLLEIINRRKQP